MRRSSQTKPTSDTSTTVFTVTRARPAQRTSQLASWCCSRPPPSSVTSTGTVRGWCSPQASRRGQHWLWRTPWHRSMKESLRNSEGSLILGPTWCQSTPGGRAGCMSSPAVTTCTSRVTRATWPASGAPGPGPAARPWPWGRESTCVPCAGNSPTASFPSTPIWRVRWSGRGHSAPLFLAMRSQPFSRSPLYPRRCLSSRLSCWPSPRSWRT